MDKMTAVNVKVNGYDKILPQGVTLEALLELLGIKTQGIAVELNHKVVPKSAFPATIMRDKDAVEIIRMTGGG
ncbi:sulfur carrier protein ThiS [bacterium]|nr:MAG: sulfur carrier protein ThiS [bacterium]